MLENKKFVFWIVLLAGSVLGSGLFAIAQAICDLTYTLGNSAQNVCGVLCFGCLVVTLVSFIVLVKDIFIKKQK